MGSINFASEADRSRLLNGPAGTRATGTSDGKSYTVVKTSDGGYVAVNSMCPHNRNVPLSWKHSLCNGNTIQCGVDHWIWSLKTGEGIDNYGRPLPAEKEIAVIEVRECDGNFSIP
ncbi:Rieske (2Fe-2S) protein [Streptomyces goshikiensis]|uniref:Rieske (2Fe-2S) protein n=1 Tax=Streptomyces goshikiensis TaxID=1942 RepID=UPI0036BDED80